MSSITHASYFSDSPGGKIAIGAAVTCVVTAVAAGVIFALAARMGGAYVPAIATTGSVAGLSLLIAGGFTFVVKRALDSRREEAAQRANYTYAREETNLTPARSDHPIKPILNSTRGLLVAAVTAYHKRHGNEVSQTELCILRQAFDHVAIAVDGILGEGTMTKAQLESALKEAFGYIRAGLNAKVPNVPGGLAQVGAPVGNKMVMREVVKIIDQFEINGRQLDDAQKANLIKALEGLVPHLTKYAIAARFDEGWNQALKEVFRAQPTLRGHGGAPVATAGVIKGWADAIQQTGPSTRR